MTGPADGALIGAKAVKTLAFEVDGTAGASWEATVDGLPVTFAGSADRARYRPQRLADGKHTLRVVVSDGSGETAIERTFTIDTKPPVLAVAAMAAGTRGKPLTLKGTTEDKSTLTANGDPVPVEAGKWETKFAAAPPTVQLVASDSAGNTRTQNVAVQSAFPLTRAVHLTARAWGYQPKHDAAMALLRAGRINAIEVDIKDEDGLIGYASKVPLAKTIGAIEPHYDTKKMIAEIHGAGGRVIGRLVAFRDPTLTKWAWTSGRHDLVLQKADGTPFTGSYGDFAFPNFANRTVQAYNVALAVEAAKLGFDDVLYDYIRRPDGKLASMRIPGLVGTPEQSVANTVAATKAGFQEAGVTTYLGVSVFGISATRPTEIAQDVALMAPHVDYVAPMVYPSHWAKGEYKVADPNNMPYEIVQRSLLDFVVKVRGTNAVIVPWL
ncbi:MAG: putative glycoside hydrolase, partial [Mycobacteriales bacterium]